MDINLKYLRQQYDWLCTMPHCEQREGLLNFIETLLVDSDEAKRLEEFDRATDDAIRDKLETEGVV